MGGAWVTTVQTYGALQLIRPVVREQPLRHQRRQSSMLKLAGVDDAARRVSGITRNPLV